MFKSSNYIHTGSSNTKNNTQKSPLPYPPTPILPPPTNVLLVNIIKSSLIHSMCTRQAHIPCSVNKPG